MTSTVTLRMVASSDGRQSNDAVGRSVGPSVTNGQTGDHKNVLGRNEISFVRLA